MVDDLTIDNLAICNGRPLVDDPNQTRQETMY